MTFTFQCVRLLVFVHGLTMDCWLNESQKLREDHIKAIDFHIILDEIPNSKLSLVMGVFGGSNESSNHYDSSREIIFSQISAVMYHGKLAKRS